MTENLEEHIPISGNSEELRKIIATLEDIRENLSEKSEIENLSKEIEKIRDEIKNGKNIYDNISQSLRSIIEGIVASEIYDIIPDGIKSSIKSRILGNNRKPTNTDAQEIFVVRFRILQQSVRAFKMCASTNRPFTFTFNDLDMVVLCDHRLAVYLKLALDDCNAPYPIEQEQRVRLTVFSKKESEKIAMWLVGLEEELALAILKVSKKTPEGVIRDALEELHGA
ncbi:MAG: hypothetical protein GYA34_15555 [Chloroflexi bacterium]|nr:hypothetical protein [Chloroflexota bacterium]